MTRKSFLRLLITLPAWPSIIKEISKPEPQYGFKSFKVDGYQLTRHPYKAGFSAEMLSGFGMLIPQEPVKGVPKYKIVRSEGFNGVSYWEKK